ncbi:MAG: hypothetical protein ACXVCE_10990 [Bacteriovorax sp.]
MHFHQLFIDGVYGLDDTRAPTEFHALAPPNREELDRVLKQIIQKVTHSSAKGMVVKESGFSLHAGGECKAHERKN